MQKNLAQLGVQIEDLTGVLITHVHSDHVNQWFVRKLIKANVPIYCPPDLELHLQVAYEALAEASHQELLKPLKSKESLLGGLNVQSFEVPHDSPGGCFGFTITAEECGRPTKVTVTTDIAHPTTSAMQHCADSDVLVLESNHDVEMLENSRRPPWLKRRIRERGHLSNEQSCEMLLGIFDISTKLPKTIMPAHISQECNTNALAVVHMENLLGSLGIDGVKVLETSAFRSSDSVRTPR